MRSQGTAHGRFQRAIHQRNVLAAEMAAREMGGLSLADALSLKQRPRLVPCTLGQFWRPISPRRKAKGSRRSPGGAEPCENGSHLTTNLAGRRTADDRARVAYARGGSDVASVRR